MPVTHPFVSGKTDGADATLVRPSDWNATHAGTNAHVLAGADHTASGLTTGHVLTATSATAFAFQASAGGAPSFLSVKKWGTS